MLMLYTHARIGVMTGKRGRSRAKGRRWVGAHGSLVSFHKCRLTIIFLYICLYSILSIHHSQTHKSTAESRLSYGASSQEEPGMPDGPGHFINKTTDENKTIIKREREKKKRQQRTTVYKIPVDMCICTRSATPVNRMDVFVMYM